MKTRVSTLKIGPDDLTPAEKDTLNGLDEGGMAKLQSQVAARVSISPEATAAFTINSFCERDMDPNHLLAELRRQNDLVASGDMGRPEGILLSQAHTLNAMFSKFVEKAQINLAAGYSEASDNYLRLALKAQSQTARTVEVLGGLKNPRQIAIVQQANISNGHQQVNNHAGKTEIQQTELSGGKSNELLQDTETSSIESAANTPMEAMGKLHRA